MRRGYRAFLMGTATDLPTRGFNLTPAKTEAIELVANLRKWNRIVSSAQQ